MCQIFYDTTTRNTSFLKMHVALKNLGIKNNKFFLMLYDSGLIGVNPRDPLLTTEMKSRIATEVRRNYWYWLREVCQVTTNAGATSYKLHIGNLSMNFLALQNFSYYHEQPRQTGKTIGDACLTGYQFAHGTRNTKFGMYSYDNPKVSENLRNILNVIDNDPEYLKVWSLKYAEDDENNISFKEKPESAKKIMSLSNDVLNNHIFGKTTGTTNEQADRAGKGATQAIQIWDETGFCKNVDTAFGSAIGAFGTAADICRANGLPYRVAMTSTPPDTNTKEGAWLQGLVFDEMCKFDPTMLDWSRDQLTAYMKKNATKDFWFISYKYYELGYTEEWLVEKQRKSSTMEIFARDYLMVWSKELKNNPYDAVLLSKLNSEVSKHTPKLFHMDNLYTFKIYNKFAQSRFGRIVVGIDISGGIGGNRDASTMVGVDPITTEVLFTFSNNTVDTNEFSRVIYKFISEYAPNALLVIERNSYGKAIIDNLKRTDLRENIYHTATSESDVLKGVLIDENINSKARNFGIFNTKGVRDTLYRDILPSRIRYHKQLFISKDIYEQIINLEERNGRIDHRQGTHDDLLIAYLFALYVLLKDNELSLYWGIYRPNPELDSDAKIAQGSLSVDRDIMLSVESMKMNINLDTNGRVMTGNEQTLSMKTPDEFFRELETQTNMFVGDSSISDSPDGDVDINFDSFYN